MTSFQNWKFASKFKIDHEDEKNIYVKCTLCLGNKILSSSKCSTSNLKKHLSKMHPHKNITTPPEIGEPKAKVMRLDFAFNSSRTNSENVSRLILNYLIADCRPLSTVDSIAFRSLLKGIGGDNIAIPARKTLTHKLDERFCEMNAKICENLQKVKHVCTTADIWSCRNRSYFGMTCHWIEEESLQRRKIALTCCRFTGRHTYDSIAEKIERVQARYKINNKVCACVTDNGSNFVKAFNVYKQSELESTEDHEDLEENTTFMDINSILNEDDGNHSLPEHVRCSSHTLSLLMTTDVPNFIRALPTNDKFLRLHNTTFAKCHKIWNKASRSTQFSDIIFEICGRKLLLPCETRFD